jgi:hypothetical protein
MIAAGTPKPNQGVEQEVAQFLISKRSRIVIGIKDLGDVCFVGKLCGVQFIHTELADLYSQKVISRMFCPADFDLRGFVPQRAWNKKEAAPVTLNKCKDA